MITQAGQAVLLGGWFDDTNGVGVAGLTVTIDVYRVALADATVSQVVTGAATTAVGGGFYCYRLVTTAGAAYYYFGRLMTADTTVSRRHAPALQIAGIPLAERINVGVDTRMAAADYTAPDNAGIAAIRTVNERFAGIAITGTVAASPAPTAGGFTVTLDAAFGGQAADLIGLTATFTAGSREPSARTIGGATVNSTTSVALTFGTAFGGSPAAGDKVLISA